jgi:predicted double-glycine peptidase
MANHVDTEMLDVPPPVSAELRKKILADPNMTKIASELEMDLETFVNTVGFYYNNRGTEPSFLVASDANLEKMGVKVPTQAELESSVRSAVAAFEAGNPTSGFDAHKKNQVEIQPNRIQNPRDDTK